jgi:adenine-specific DNA glycosylase
MACVAHREGSTHRIPPALPRARTTTAEFYLVAVASPAGWLLCPPAAKGLLAGLWGWPQVATPSAAPTPSATDLAAEASLPYGTRDARSWPGWVQVYTHRRETIHPVAYRLEASRQAPDGLVWISSATLPTLPMGNRDQRLRSYVLAPAGTWEDPAVRAPLPLPLPWPVLAGHIWLPPGDRTPEG